ncbi:hypothetical protein [Nitrincola alkalilacustris]|uniref:hypothetical protein n=1 Tax=Nitrincola alkalilacustris TaxID=1571224 RepID=UPI00124C890A|nr:hypothetical protein [Nitrincola alkalilacustris]
MKPHYTVLPVLLLSVLLLGCQDANVQPSAPAAAPSAGASDIPELHELNQDNMPEPISRLETADGSSGMSGFGDQSMQPSSAPPSISSQLDQLTGRLTLLQEQVIQIRSGTQQLMEQNQILLSRLQMLTESRALAQSSGGAGMDEDMAEQLVQDIDAAISQLMQVANMQSPEAMVSGPYRIVSAYTRSGDWIVLRYHTESGESWLAERGGWIPLKESSSPRSSSFEISVQRADQDQKGYVATRIDRRSGRSWWLNGDTWQAFDL